MFAWIARSWRRAPGRHSVLAQPAAGTVLPGVAHVEPVSGFPTPVPVAAQPTVVLGFGDGSVLPLEAPAAEAFQAIAEALSYR